jgi:hypothetical protein
VPDLHATSGVATVARFDAPIVAPLVGIHRTVAADINANTRLADEATAVALLDDLAVTGTAVAVHRVPVVTRFAGTDRCVAADDG